MLLTAITVNQQNSEANEMPFGPAPDSSEKIRVSRGWSMWSDARRNCGWIEFDRRLDYGEAVFIPLGQLVGPCQLVQVLVFLRANATAQAGATQAANFSCP